ncbi:MAG: nucleotide exchange factor GrpE [Candidatus Magasanikbacteria bacterium]|nr:nucleotide exchange factor GrpE [Candidatus Magasanikbacteria bacterium]
MTDEQKPIEENLNEEPVISNENEESSQEDADEEIKEKSGFFSRKCKNCEDHTVKEEEYKKDWQRALADYKNLQKETSERRGEWAQMSKVNILEDFIPVYDNFKSAFFHHPVLQADNEEHKQMKNWIDGIGFIMKQFGDVMKSHGIEEIKTVGEKFDPNMHESMGEEEVEGKEPGTILKELIGGYKMGNKIIKAAKVIIAK